MAGGGGALEVLSLEAFSLKSGFCVGCSLLFLTCSSAVSRSLSFFVPPSTLLIIDSLIVRFESIVSEVNSPVVFVGCREPNSLGGLAERCGLS